MDVRIAISDTQALEPVGPAIVPVFSLGCLQSTYFQLVAPSSCVSSDRIPVSKGTNISTLI